MQSIEINEGSFEEIRDISYEMLIITLLRHIRPTELRKELIKSAITMTENQRYLTNEQKMVLFLFLEGMAQNIAQDICQQANQAASQKRDTL